MCLYPTFVKIYTDFRLSHNSYRYAQRSTVIYSLMVSVCMQGVQRGLFKWFIGFIFLNKYFLIAVAMCDLVYNVETIVNRP